MLTPGVKQTLQGQSALTNPAHPQLVYDWLRAKYPAAQGQLVVALGKTCMLESEKAMDFLMKIQKLYATHHSI